MKKKDEILSAPGRPREFDMSIALDKAITQFSQYGYHGTSIADLNACLGLTSGSIYKAWGDKKGLFIASLQHYIAKQNEALKSYLKESASGKDKLSAIFKRYVEMSSGEQGLIGCLVIESSAELSIADDEILNIIKKQQDHQQRLINNILKEGQSDGSISSDINCATMAQLVSALLSGIRLKGKLGASSDTLQAMTSDFMKLL